jgi:hypothetical protein
MKFIIKNRKPVKDEFIMQVFGFLVITLNLIVQKRHVASTYRFFKIWFDLFIHFGENKLSLFTILH